MTYIIPSQSTKQLRQLNTGDLSGELFVTKNINLDEEGYIKLAPTAVSFYSTANDADFDTADVLFTTDEATWAVSSEMFVASNIGGSNQTVTDRGGDTNAPSGGVEEDGIFFNDTEVVSSGTGIKYISGATTWTTVGLSLSSSFPTSMALFDGANGLMVGNNNTVQLVNTSWSSVVTLTIPNIYAVTSVCANGSRAYIGTRHKANGEARMFLWDGVSTAADQSYPCGSFEISSIKPYGSSVVALTSSGQLLRFNGGGFEELAQLPPYITQREWANASNEYSRVSNRGLDVDGNLVYIILSSTYESTIYYDGRFLSGVWVYDPKIGLYHKHGASRTSVRFETIATSDVDISTNVITVTTAPETGDEIFYEADSGATIGGLKDLTRHFAIKTSSTTFKVADTYADAIANIAINLTSTGNSSQEFFFFTHRDYGNTWSIDGRQAITTITSNLGSRISGRYIFTSGTYNDDASADVTVWNTTYDFLSNRGYFITPRLNSYDILDNTVNVGIKYKPLKDGDKIIVKYKTQQYDLISSNIPYGDTGSIKGTWTDSNTFTTTRNLSDVAVGDEVEIVSGIGAGYLVHIESISESSGTYTVNLTETVPPASSGEKMDFVIDRWTKIFEIENDTSSFEANVNNEKGFAVFPIVSDGTFLQLKVELRGVEVTIEELQVNNKPILGIERVLTTS